MRLDRSILMVQRRVVTVKESEAALFELIEPLFMIDTHMSLEERLHLFRLAWSLPSRFVACEIGSYVGASTAFLATAASRKGGHVHAVDTWQNDAMGCEPPRDTFGLFQENTRPLRNFITTHRGRAEQLKDQIPPVNLLFLDGDHSYAATKANLDDYAAKIKRGGILAVHDIHYDDVQRAVRNAFQSDTWVDIGVVDSLQSFRVGRPLEA
jgi:predicted O-methyltransferase YrrM